MEKKEQFSEGDVVKCIVGGPKMCIEAIDPEVRCVYWDEEKSIFIRESFKEGSLKLSI